MNGASRHDGAVSVAAAPPEWTSMGHSTRQDHDHHAGGGSSVGWNYLDGNARSDTGRWAVWMLEGFLSSPVQGMILLLLL